MKPQSNPTQLTLELIARLRRPAKQAAQDEPPLDCYPAVDLVAELILRGLETNGLQLVPVVERMQLAVLLLKAGENQGALRSSDEGAR